MANCDFKYSDETPVYTLEDYQIYQGTDNTLKGQLILTKRTLRGLMPFGTRAGVLTEDKLTNSICEFLSTKEEFAKFIVPKEKESKTTKK